MFDHASTNIERMAAAHQKQLDDEAAEDALQEAEELAITKDPQAVANALDYLTGDEWPALNLLIGKMISQYQYYGDERDQGILDTAQEICDLCQRVISERATVNRRAAMKAFGDHFPYSGE